MLGLGVGLTLPKTSTLTHKIRYLKIRTGEIAEPDNHYNRSATWRVSMFVIPLIELGRVSCTIDCMSIHNLRCSVQLKSEVEKSF